MRKPTVIPKVNSAPHGTLQDWESAPNVDVVDRGYDSGIDTSSDGICWRYVDIERWRETYTSIQHREVECIFLDVVCPH